MLFAGNIETIVVAKIEQNDINKTDLMFISEGILLKKYISSGNNEILNILLKKDRIFSIYIENSTPIVTPKNVAVTPI